jgi:2-methylcitrate dehydratase PrpD
MTITSGARRPLALLGASAGAMLGMAGAAHAQAPKDEPKAKDAPQPKAKGKAGQGKASQGSAVRVSPAIAEFITGFDLKTVPQPVIERARMVFIDTVGVMLAGSHEEASHLIAAMVKAEGSAPQASIVQETLRASPQLAALANGVAAHGMDYDFTFMRAQAIAAVIPAILPVAETTKATPAEIVAAFIIGAEVAARIVRADQDGPMFDGWHSTGMVGVLGAAAACARLMKCRRRRSRT